MLLPSYEIDFLRSLDGSYRQWLQESDAMPPEPGDDFEFEMIEFIDDAFTHLLRIDQSALEELYQRRYNDDPVGLAIKTYQPEKFVLFLAAMSHVAIEDDVRLWLPHIEITGRYYGNWATGHTQQDEVGRIVSRRLLYSVGREYYADIYRAAYADPAVDSTAQFLARHTISLPAPPVALPTPQPAEQSADTTAEEKESERQAANERSLVVPLLASAAAIGGAVLSKWVDRFRVWVDTAAAHQTMVTIGHAAGSVRFYGFCMERPKPGPKSHVTYRPVPVEALHDSAREVYDRITDFAKLVTALDRSVTPEVAALIREREDDAWFVLQRFFWLITQPFVPFAGQEEPWREFIERRYTAPTDFEAELRALGLSVQMEGDPQAENGPKIDIDPDKDIFVRLLLDLVVSESIPVHPSNAVVLSQLLTYANSADGSDAVT
jgi:hypothetical protein